MRHKQRWRRSSGYPFRGLFDITPFVAAHSGATGDLTGLNFSAVTAYQNPASSNEGALVNLLNDDFPTGIAGFVWMGGWNDATGAFKIDEGPAQMEDVLNFTDGTNPVPVKNHPKMDTYDKNGGRRHIYKIADDTQIDYALSGGELAEFDSFIARVKAVDPLATCMVGHFRTSPDRITQFAGHCDAISLDGYPNGVPSGQVVSGVPQANYDTTRIPTQASIAAAAGIPYYGVLSAHEYSNVSLPTPETYTYMMNQWKATNMLGYFVYGWKAEEPNDDLSDDANLRARVGVENAAVMY